MTYGSYFGYYYAPQFQYKGTNIYIRGLHPSTNDDDLVKIVSEFGNILSSKAIVDLKTGVCKGYGFAMYENDAQAEMAMQGLSMKGFLVSLAVATPRDNSNDFNGELQELADYSSTNVYVSNLPMEMVHDDDLRQLSCDPLGIDSCKILVDNKGNSRGVGFVRFHTREAAQQMITNFDGKFLAGSKEALQVRFADSEAQKAYKGMFKLYKKSMSMYSLHPQLFYPSHMYFGNSRESSCALSDSTLVDEGMEEMDELTG